MDHNSSNSSRDKPAPDGDKKEEEKERWIEPEDPLASSKIPAMHKEGLIELRDKDIKAAKKKVKAMKKSVTLALAARQGWSKKEKMEIYPFKTVHISTFGDLPGVWDDDEDEWMVPRKLLDHYLEYPNMQRRGKFVTLKGQLSWMVVNRQIITKTLKVICPQELQGGCQIEGSRTAIQPGSIYGHAAKHLVRGDSLQPWFNLYVCIDSLYPLLTEPNSYYVYQLQPPSVGFGFLSPSGNRGTMRVVSGLFNRIKERVDPNNTRNIQAAYTRDDEKRELSYVLWRIPTKNDELPSNMQGPGLLPSDATHLNNRIAKELPKWNDDYLARAKRDWNKKRAKEGRSNRREKWSQQHESQFWTVTSVVVQSPEERVAIMQHLYGTDDDPDCWRYQETWERVSPFPRFEGKVRTFQRYVLLRYA